LGGGFDREDIKKKIMKEASRSGQDYILESDTSSLSETSEIESENLIKEEDLSQILEEC